MDRQQRDDRQTDEEMLAGMRRDERMSALKFAAAGLAGLIIGGVMLRPQLQAYFGDQGVAATKPFAFAGAVTAFGAAFFVAAIVKYLRNLD